MSREQTEACGRCSLTTVVDTADGDGENPYDGGRIELSEDQLRRGSIHAVAAGRVKSRLNELSRRLVYGR